MKKTIITIALLYLSLGIFCQQVPDWKVGASMSLTTQDIAQTLKIAKQAGIEYVEVGMPKFSRMDVAEITSRVTEYKKAADAAGITIWSVHIPYGWDYDVSLPDPILREQCKQYILFTLEMAKGLGEYKKAILHPSFEPIDPVKRISHIAALRESLKEIGPLIEEKYKIRLAIECLPRTCLGNAAVEMLTILGDIPSVDVCLDTNHLLGEKSEYFAEAVGNRIKTLHISDYDEVDERHWLPGKGVINFPAVIDALVKSGYDGPFMFEVSRGPWNGDMKKFCEDLVGCWEQIKKDYAAWLKKK